MTSLFAKFSMRVLSAAAVFALPVGAVAAVLPDDRADALYHRYEGGGVTIQGPSVLVRKKMAEKYAVSANYYQDMITSASIDVEVSGASEYKEERDQYSLGFEYLRGKTTYNLGYTNSEENDYEANTASFGLSQDLFGDLTTITMGFSRGSDKVRNSTDPSFEEDIDRWSYRVGVSQILTKSLISSLNFEVITDEGFLNNPYRSYRYVNPTDPRLFVLEQEIYPRTRTSNAAALNARYFLPYRAAVYGGYRFFTDTWGIRADTFELGYIHPIQPQWTLEARVRYYQQDNADFYSDLFDRVNQQNFLARDKELSTFNSVAFRIGASYEFAQSGWRFVKRGSLNLFYDRIEFKYDDFRDARFSRLPSSDPNFRPAGSEPLYEFGANVIQAFVSIWF
ncbi:DUF3570 domain-containing protein [Steroidobacter sp. S1-65]|uniref:DUF3570 domain-containing protein n=1 Tax=Steroidobacter gossypii TaxID=2805490 RepID=A0ABS1X2F6_9GAMM|nr:DUF3570 domain-containing protein [Steroidobacter gossypii]MBM0107411.1 DUF3570 domain-containing protein [Steroidobacter gossypii]